MLLAQLHRDAGSLFDILTRLGEAVTFEDVERERKKSRERRSGFRSIEEMNAADSVDARGGDFGRFLRHCAQYWQLAPRVYPRGVFRFRSIDEADAASSRHRPPPRLLDRYQRR